MQSENSLSVSANRSDADRYGVVGDPIAHSKSPLIHRSFAAATRQNLSYEKFHVTADHFAHFVKDFFASGGKGLNITIPHKIAAATLATTLTPRATKAGAVNTLYLDPKGALIGDNTDGAGLVADLLRLSVPLKASRLAILGAGGAVRGILGPLLEKEPASIWVANRHLDRAEALVKEFSSYSTGTPLRALSLDALHELGAVDVLLQATPLGLHGERPDIPESLIGLNTFAYDLSYGEEKTVFETWARSQGAQHTASGIGMLIEQAAEAFAVWRGIRPHTSALHAELGSSLQRSSSLAISNNP